MADHLQMFGNDPHPRSGASSPATSQAADAESVDDMVHSLLREKGVLLQPSAIAKIVEKGATALVDVLTKMHENVKWKDPNRWFHQPVTDAIAPQYSTIIKRPMDLGTMGEKIPMYPMIASYERDLKLVVDNCVEYNGAASPVTAAASKLLKDGGVEIRKAKRELKKQINALIRPFLPRKTTKKDPRPVSTKGKGKVIPEDAGAARKKRPADMAFAPAPSTSAPQITFHLGGVPVSDDAAWKRPRVEPVASLRPPTPPIVDVLPDILAAAERGKRVVDDTFPRSVLGVSRLARNGSMSIVVRHGGPEVTTGEVIQCAPQSALEPPSGSGPTAVRPYDLSEFLRSNPSYNRAAGVAEYAGPGEENPQLLNDAETDGYMDTDTKAYCESIVGFTRGLGDGVKYAKEYADAMVNKITLGRSSGKPEELPQTTPEVDPNRVKMRLYHEILRDTVRTSVKTIKFLNDKLKERTASTQTIAPSDEEIQRATRLVKDLAKMQEPPPQ